VSEVEPELERDAWRDLLEQLSSQYQGYAVTIEAVNREYGDQVVVEDLPLSYIEYDPKDDVFIVAVDSNDGTETAVLRHMIEHPQGILADKVSGDVPWAVDVIAQDGSQTIVTLRRRPGLPPPPG
jgi:hypothetical protein